MRIGGTRRNPSSPSSSSGSNVEAYRNSMAENLWGNIGFVIGLSVVACFPAMIFGVLMGGRILSNIPAFIVAALLAGGSFYLVRNKPRTALLFPASITAFFLLGWLISSSGKPDPKDLKVAEKEGRRHDALFQGKAVGQCKDKWERGITAVGVKDIFRQSWWDAALKPNLDLASSSLEQLATSVNSCLEASPPGLTRAQGSLVFDANLSLYPIQLSDIHTTIDLSRKAFALAQKKVTGSASGDDLLQLSIKVRQLDSIGRDPLSAPNTRIGKIPGTGVGM